MKKYLLISLFFHILISSLFYIKIDNSKLEQQHSDKLKNGQPEVIEINPVGIDKIAKIKKNYYWGIGIAQIFDEVIMFGNKVNAYRITQVYSGYCAESNGLMIGDKIYLVNGELISELNSVKGNGPKKLVLTFERNGSTMIIQVERCKVWF